MGKNSILIDICNETENCQTSLPLSFIKGEEKYDQENSDDNFDMNSESSTKKRHFDKYKSIIEV